MIFVADCFKSFVNLADFAQPEFSLGFSFNKLSIGHDEQLFNVEADPDGYTLSLKKSASGVLLLERNNSVVSANLCPYDFTKVTIWAIVSPKELRLVISSNNKIELSSSLDTFPTYPPTELVSYIRNRSLRPSVSYETEEELREKIQSNFLWLSKKISSTGGYKSYWNIHYDGKKITDRIPKRETEVQPLIHQAIFDVMEASGISMVGKLYRTSIYLIYLTPPNYPMVRPLNPRRSHNDPAPQTTNLARRYLLLPLHGPLCAQGLLVR